MHSDAGRTASVPGADPTTDVAALSRRRAESFAAAFATEADFRVFYERTLPTVYGYLIRRCGGDVALAEDLAQATFMEVVRRRGAYGGRSDVLTWIIGIARHKLIDTFRRQARDAHRRFQLEVREITQPAEGAAGSQAGDAEQLAELLGRLPALQRAALVLHYADGLPVREVAKCIHRSESATESLLTRGRGALRAAWREAVDD